MLHRVTGSAGRNRLMSSVPGWQPTTMPCVTMGCPPLHRPSPTAPAPVPRYWAQQIAQRIIYEDDRLLVINKPSGLAVHGGSGLSFGLIESLRQLRPDDRYLELVHRLDRDTSGVIMIARRPAILRELHRQLREDKIDKRYLALVEGEIVDSAVRSAYAAFP